jgi:phage terminase large subunit-like protein
MAKGNRCCVGLQRRRNSRWTPSIRSIGSGSSTFSPSSTEQGHITATRGSVIDYEAILADSADLAERYRVTVVLDGWNSTATISRLQELGIECVTFGRGFASMSGSMKETERLILPRQLRHDGSPVLRWNVGNVDVAQDAASNIKPDRARSRE